MGMASIANKTFSLEIHLLPCMQNHFNMMYGVGLPSLSTYAFTRKLSNSSCKFGRDMMFSRVNKHRPHPALLECRQGHIESCRDKCCAFICYIPILNNSSNISINELFNIEFIETNRSFFTYMYITTHS